MIRFSLDSVSTAVDMADEVPVMVIAVGVMMFAAKAIGAFVDVHPIIRVPALF